MGNPPKFEYSPSASVGDWSEVIHGAATDIPNVYSAGFFAKRFISIPDQQVRAFNLSFALARTGRVKKAKRVAIVGAGVSGMTTAVALTMLTGCQVLLFERDTVLLRKFREASFRFIHPDMNASTDSNAADFHIEKRTDFAFMNWSANRAPAVAEEICRKFDHYRSFSPISLHLGEGVDDISSSEKGVTLLFDAGEEVTCDLAILATGFGDEKRSPATTDASYWHSGNTRQYEATLQQRALGHSSGRASATKQRVLISGNGDSGIIELAHFLIEGFRHEMVAQMLASNNVAPSFGETFSNRVESLWFRRIEFHEDDEEGSTLVGPLSWYWWMREIKQSDPIRWNIVGQGVARDDLMRLFEAFDAKLSGVAKHQMLPKSLTRVMQSNTEAILDQMASVEISHLMSGFDPETLPPPQDIQFRNDFAVSFVGTTPKPYTRKQSPQNWLLLYYLNRFGRFQYLKGRFENAEIVDNEIQCSLRDLVKDEQFHLSVDRLVVRQGPDYNTLAYRSVGTMHDNSEYQLTHLPNLEWVPRTKEERDGNQFVTFFRTREWKKAVNAKLEFSDYLDGEEPLTSDRQMVRQLDACLLDLLRLGHGDAAAKMYRRAKAVTKTSIRLSVLAEMTELRASVIALSTSIRQQPN